MTYFPLHQTTCFFIPLVAPCKPLLTNDLNDMGYAYFDWNVSAADTASDATRYTVIENFKESVPKHDYSVVLQHDTNAFSVDAVEEILSWGIKNGYSFRALDLTSPAVHHSVAN